MPSAATLSKPSVVLNRRYNAPPAKVFAAWTEPQEIVRWFGASDARADTIKAVTDVRREAVLPLVSPTAAASFSK